MLTAQYSLFINSSVFLFTTFRPLSNNHFPLPKGKKNATIDGTLLKNHLQMIGKLRANQLID